MQLSQKEKKFSAVYFCIWKSTLKFEHFQKKDNPHSRCISEITESEKRG